MGQLGMNIFVMLMGIFACGVGVFCFISEHRDNKKADEEKTANEELVQEDAHKVKECQVGKEGAK